MRISHIQTVSKPSSIIVRNYDNKSIVHWSSAIQCDLLEKLDFEVGAWKIKYKNFVPKEYLATFEYS